MGLLVQKNFGARWPQIQKTPAEVTTFFHFNTDLPVNWFPKYQGAAVIRVKQLCYLFLQLWVRSLDNFAKLDSCVVTEQLHSALQNHSAGLNAIRSMIYL